MSAIILYRAAPAAAALRDGSLVALPTETVYGLGANALDQEAVGKIFAAKNRPNFDPLIIHQSSADRILRYAAKVPAPARRLAEAFWPGPLTLVLPKGALVSDLVSAGLPTVALRVPDHALTRDVLARVDFPVAAPSANPFGFVSPTTARHVADQLAGKIDFILDGGPCGIGLESTIVGFSGDQPTVLRKGGLPVEDIEAVLGTSVRVRTHGSSQPEAPGMLSRHYSPGVPLVILSAPAATYPLTDQDAFIAFGKTSLEAVNAAGCDLYQLSAGGSLTEAAANLFATLRRVATRRQGTVYAERVPETGLGRAINDRLLRAAARE